MAERTPQPRPVVFVVDDDPSVRAGLSLLFKSVGLDVEVFASVPDLLRKSLPSVPSCLVLDIRLPGQGGLDLQSALAKENNPIPIVFMTAHGDIPMSVEAMKAGAIDFLPKPFRDQAMLDAVGRAIESDRRRREDEQALRTVRSRYEGLTRRERDVLALVAAGLMNKQIAAEIGIAEQTVKIHRSHVMNKMAAKSVVDLARMAQMLGVRGKTLP